MRTVSVFLLQFASFMNQTIPLLWAGQLAPRTRFCSLVHRHGRVCNIRQLHWGGCLQFCPPGLYAMVFTMPNCTGDGFAVCALSAFQYGDGGSGFVVPTRYKPRRMSKGLHP